MILFDPADGEFPVGFNILSAHSEIEKDILSSDLVAAFKRLSTSWGDQMNSVLAKRHTCHFGKHTRVRHPCRPSQILGGEGI